MGVREALQNNGSAGYWVAAALGLVAILLTWGLMSNRVNVESLPKAQAYFSIDFGKTYFSADLNNDPPFLHQDKEALRVFLYTCDDGQSSFVAYLEKFTPEAKAKLIAARDSGVGIETLLNDISMDDRMISKPGGEVWVKQSDEGAAELFRVKCPDGSRASAVLP